MRKSRACVSCLAMLGGLPHLLMWELGQSINIHW